MADPRLPRQPQVGDPMDYDFFKTYYDAIMDISKATPDFWIDASNNDDNNDAADLSIGRIRIVAGRHKIKNMPKGNGGLHVFNIELPAGFTKVGKNNTKADLFDPIILVTPESKKKTVDDPVAMVVQSVDEDKFTVVVKEVKTAKGDMKELHIDYINYLAIGFTG